MSAGSNGRQGLRYQKLSEEIVEVLQQMIVSGELESGRKVTQEELAGMLGVSTMPIREALLKLSAVGLVDAAPNRSFHVVTTTAADVQDSYWMHAALEGELTRRACVNRGADLVSELRRHEDAYEQAAAAGDDSALQHSNTAFHRVINTAANSPRLLFLLKTTLRFSREGWYPRLDGWVPRSIESHLGIIEAFEHGNAEEAGQLARQHVLDAGEMLLDYFEATGEWVRGSAPAGVPDEPPGSRVNAPKKAAAGRRRRSAS
jgi:DNA-binding GntR family transcriptional regulator